MSTYERVTFRPEGAARSTTVILRDPIASEAMLRGVEVNREGDEVAPAGFDQRLRIIGLDLVSKRTPLSMNLHYGELEPA